MMGIGMSCVACGSYGIRQIAYKIAARDMGNRMK